LLSENATSKVVAIRTADKDGHEVTNTPCNLLLLTYRVSRTILRWSSPADKSLKRKKSDPQPLGDLMVSHEIAWTNVRRYQYPHMQDLLQSIAIKIKYRRAGIKSEVEILAHRYVPV